MKEALETAAWCLKQKVEKMHRKHQSTANYSLLRPSNKIAHDGGGGGGKGHLLYIFVIT